MKDEAVLKNGDVYCGPFAMSLPPVAEGQGMSLPSEAEGEGTSLNGKKKLKEKKYEEPTKSIFNFFFLFSFFFVFFFARMYCAWVVVVVYVGRVKNKYYSNAHHFHKKR